MAHLWIRGKKYYYYDTFKSWADAYNIARYYHKKNPKCRYFIVKVEKGYLFPSEYYKLYLTKVARLGLI